MWRPQDAQTSSARRTAGVGTGAAGAEGGPTFAASAFELEIARAAATLSS
jgi:hypothetical protein